MIGKLFWVLLTAVFTFGFVVLFENGTDNYVANCQTEFQDLKAFVGYSGEEKSRTPPVRCSSSGVWCRLVDGVNIDGLAVPDGSALERHADFNQHPRRRRVFRLYDAENSRQADQR